jgi:hypothetical protein
MSQAQDIIMSKLQDDEEITFDDLKELAINVGPEKFVSFKNICKKFYGVLGDLIHGIITNLAFTKLEVLIKQITLIAEEEIAQQAAKFPPNYNVEEMERFFVKYPQYVQMLCPKLNILSSKNLLQEWKNLDFETLNSIEEEAIYRVIDREEVSTIGGMLSKYRDSPDDYNNDCNSL